MRCSSTTKNGCFPWVGPTSWEVNIPSSDTRIVKQWDKHGLEYLKEIVCSDIQKGSRWPLKAWVSLSGINCPSHLCSLVHTPLQLVPNPHYPWPQSLSLSMLITTILRAQLKSHQFCEAILTTTVQTPFFLWILKSELSLFLTWQYQYGDFALIFHCSHLSLDD